MKKVFSSIVFCSALLAGNAAQAAYVPVGVQNDVATGSVTSWGYNEIYRGAYADSFNLLNVLSGLNANDWIMFAGYKVGSAVYDVLASARLSDVLQITGHNQTHAANGAEWYRNDNSVGFAGLGDQINQTSADTCGAWVDCGEGLAERDRLSWHSWDGTNIFGGWRSGSNYGLNGSTDWQRVILVQNAEVSNVPVPAAIWLFGSGLVGLLGFNHKRAQSAA